MGNILSHDIVPLMFRIRWIFSGYRAHAGSVSPVRHRNADHRYSTDYDHSGGPPRSHGFGSSRDPGRHRDYSPPYGRFRQAGRFVGRSYDGPGYGARQVRGEGLPRSNPNVRPRDGDWMCPDPLYVLFLTLPYFF